MQTCSTNCIKFSYEERGSIGTVDRMPEFDLQCTVLGTCFYSKPGFEALSFKVRYKQISTGSAFELQLLFVLCEEQK